MLRDEDPHGTVEELLAVGADLRKIGSCSRKRKDEDGNVAIIGCPVRKWCELPEKEGKGPATSGCNGAGPCRKGLLVIKVGPDGKKTVTRTVLDCFHIPGFRKRIEEKRTKHDPGSVEIIASEGESIELPGSELKNTALVGQVPRFEHVEGVSPMKIEKFPRPGQPGQRINLPGHKIAMEVTARLRAEKRAGKTARLLGVEEEDDATGIPENRP